MKKLSVLLTLMFTFLIVSVDGQDDNFKRFQGFALSESWSLDLDLGFTQFHGDLASSDIPFEKVAEETHLGGALQLQKYFNPWLSLGGRLMYGQLDGQEDRPGKRYFHNRFLEWNAFGQINMSNLFWDYKPERKWTITGFAGIGIIDFRTNAYQGDTWLASLGYNNMGEDKAQRTSELIFPGGLGLNYRFNERWDINTKATMHLVNSDKLDYYMQGDWNDAFAFYSFGAVYHFNMPELGNGLAKMVRDFETVELKAVPEVLEVHGDTVPVKITGKIPPKYFKKKAAVTMTPVLIFEGDSVALNPITLQGESVEGDGIVINYNEGGTFTVTDYVTYNPNMNVSELKVTPVAYMPSGTVNKSAATEEILLKETSVELGNRKLADGVIYTSKRILHDEDIFLAPHGYKGPDVLSEKATIWFAKDKHNLNWRLSLNSKDEAKAQLDKLYDFMKLGYEIKDISIDAWASPEGEESFNEGLSERRSNTAENYLMSVFSKLYYDKESKMTIRKPADSVEIGLNWHGEDWDGFMAALDASDIADKNIIKNVVNSQPDVTKREQEIRNMTVIYTEIEDFILPPLRRAEIIVNCIEPAKSDEEIAALSTTYPDSLNVTELLYAATLTDDMDAKLQIYKSATTVYPEEWKGYNNAAYILLQKDELDEAESYLEKASKLMPNSSTILNNLGAVASKKDEFSKAMSYYNSAGSRSNNGYNLGIIKITKGDYNGALNAFGRETCRYNIALAQTITGNFSSAASNLECAEEAAANYYLMAIIGARSGNDNMLYENLGKAVKMNPDYAKQALTDREFMSYFAKPEFMNILK